MKHVIGVLLIVIGLALVLIQGDRSSIDEEHDHSQNDIEADRDPEQVDTELDTIRIQPILGIVFMLGGAGFLIYAYSERKNKLSSE
ncbi:MAG: hypothetical protein WD267_08580 [Balneolales bacterium]